MPEFSYPRISLRRINVDVSDKEYLDFLSVCIKDSLSVEDKLKAIIRYHVIIYQNRKKIRNQRLFS